jgi:peptidyl-prolyl cis-trans isomerase SurA
MTKKVILALGILGLGYTAAAQKQYADKIVAIVGSKVILQSEIGKQYLGTQEEQKINLPEFAKCELLKDAIAAKILVEQAARDSVLVDPEEVESRLDYQITNVLHSGFGGDKAAMERQMGKTIYQIKEEYREIIKEGLTRNKMMQEVIQSVNITPKEVEEYFKKIPEDQLSNIPASVEVGQIVYKPDVDPEVEKYTKEQVESIRKQIVEEGKSFATMAQIYSEDAGANNGGEMSLNRKQEEIDSRFVAATFKLQPGEISPVFRSSFGYHIIEMLERNGDDAKIRYIVVIPKQTSSDFAKAMTKMDSVRNELIASKITFNEAVNKISNDEMSKQSGGMIRDQYTGKTILSIDNIREADLAVEVTGLDVGEYSKPQVFTDVDQNKKVRILYLKSKTAPHQLNLKDDYNTIQENALQVKKMEYLNKWIGEKKDGYYIKIDPNYVNSCPELGLFLN